MAASNATQATIPAQDAHSSLILDDDSDDDELPPIEMLRVISDR